MAALMAALTATKGTHFMHSRDTSVEVTLSLAQGEQALAVVLGLAGAVLEALAFRPEVAARLAAADFCTITDLADALVRDADLPFRVAHEVCAVLVRDALEAGRGPDSLGAATVNAAATARAGRPVTLSEATVRAALDARVSVENRRGPGGTSPATVRAAVAQARARLEADRATLDGRAHALAAAHAELERRATVLAGG